jgi:hypothetical protein
MFISFHLAIAHSPLKVPHVFGGIDEAGEAIAACWYYTVQEDEWLKLWQIKEKRTFEAFVFHEPTNRLVIHKHILKTWQL